MKRNLMNTISVISFVVLSFCAACSSTVSTQTPGVVIDGGNPVRNTPAFIPSPTSTVTVLPSPVPSVEIIINSAKEEVGTLFVGTDGSIVRRLALGLELSAVPKASFLYRAYPAADGTGIQVDKFDFYGKVEESRTISIRGENSSQFFFNYSVSPDGKWITYMHGESDYDPRLSPNIDLWLLNVEQKEGTPLVVTKNHRSTNEPVTWTLVGDTFVYADKDENGIVQLYEMYAETQKTTQVTHFDESFRGQWIYQAKLSPDDRRIAFTTQTESGLGKAGVVDVDEKKVIWMQMPPGGYQPLNNPLWWDQSGSQIMVLIEGTHAGDANDSRIIWYDVVSGNAVETFPESGQRPQSVEHAFPLQDIEVVGFWGYDPDIADKQYWLYASKSKNLKKMNLPDLGLSRYQFIQLDDK